MGLFDWFTTAPSNVTILDDRIWLTRKAKIKGIGQMVAQNLTGKDHPQAMILVAHFRDCLDELQKISESVTDSTPIVVVSAETLQSVRTSTLSSDETRPIQIIIGERHPLLSHDDAVLEFARSLECRCQLVHHVSLEDPIIRAFSAEWVKGLLKSLGMAEDEVIESKLVARQFIAAQKKLASQCSTDFPADSAEKWMERNCSEIWPKDND